MNILEQEDIIKGLPDQALMQEAQMPSGQVPQYLVVSEIQRRSDMRKRYKSEQEQMPQGTVKDKVVQEGIMASMPPQMAMAPQMPQRMPNMPSPQMPPQGIEQTMPPQMMAEGGIVQMSNVGRVPILDRYVPSAGFGPVMGGSTVKDQIDRIIDEGMMSGADLLDFVSRSFGGSPEVVEYVSARLGRGLGMESGKELAVPPRDAETQLSEMRGDRPMLAAGMDTQPESVFVTAPLFPDVPSFDNTFSPSVTVPNVLLPETPLPTDGREPVASQLAKRTLDRYTDYDPVSPVFSEQGIFGVQGGAESGVAALPTESDIADARAAYMGRTVMPPAGDARMQALESAEVQSAPALTARQRAQEQRGGDPLFTDVSLSEIFGTGRGTRRGVREAELRGERSIQDINAELGIGPSGPANPFGTDGSEAGRFGGTTPETRAIDALVKLPSLDRSNPASMDITSPDYDLAGVIARNKGIYDPFKFDLTTDETESKRAPNTQARSDAESRKDPTLDFSDLIADSRRQAMSNALIQLGAGIAGGDVSKGIAAAGQAATAGTQDARDLDMKRRLAQYKAGREDLRREEETRRYEEGMKLKREQFETDVGYKAAKLSADIEAAEGVSRRALLSGVNNLIKEASDELKLLATTGTDEQILEIQTYINTLRGQANKYMNEIARGLAERKSYEGFELVSQR